MDDNKEVKFLPFHAINEFMNDDYRSNVVQVTLNGLASLPSELRKPIDQFTNHFVKVTGFRNSIKAPVYLKIKPYVEAFQKQPKLVAATLIAWAAINQELQNQVFEVLQTRHWELLPIDTDRTKLPGFLIVWPKDETFDTIYQSFKETYPNSTASNDDVSLMTVWLSDRLPFPSDQQSSEPAPS
jgi:hypothetical protein